MMYHYPKKIRLRSKKLITELFDKGNVISKYPLRMVWLEVDELPEDVLLQAAVSVSKKKFKRAVKRNLLKRRMREAVRLNMQELKQNLLEKDKKIVFMLIYVSGEVKPYDTIEKALKLSFSSLIRQLNDDER